jgi:protein SCO1/2
LLAVLAFALAACGPAGSDLPVLGNAPDFALLDQQGRTLSTSDLRGRVALVNFIFTTCADICPMLSASMQRTQEKLRADGLLGSRAVLVSITVDPQRDTPPVLAAYAERFGADPEAWRFLTGNPELVRQLVNEGFKVGAMPGQAGEPGRDIVHGSRFVLVDSKGQVRAYLPGDNFDVEGAVREVQRLSRE